MAPPAIFHCAATPTPLVQPQPGGQRSVFAPLLASWPAKVAHLQENQRLSGEEARISNLQTPTQMLPAATSKSRRSRRIADVLNPSFNALCFRGSAHPCKLRDLLAAARQAHQGAGSCQRPDGDSKCRCQRTAEARTLPQPTAERSHLGHRPLSTSELRNQTGETPALRRPCLKQTSWKETDSGFPEAGDGVAGACAVLVKRWGPEGGTGQPASLRSFGSDAATTAARRAAAVRATATSPGFSSGARR